MQVVSYLANGPNTKEELRLQYAEDSGGQVG